MANIKSFLTKILKLEGGYVNHPNDKGGCTNKGITLSVFKYYYGSDKTCKDLKNITDEQVENIYLQGFWNPCWGDKIQCPRVANLIVDWAVNSGVKTAIKGVQKIVGTTVDGIMGNITLKAINSYPSKDLFDEIKKVRSNFYNEIVENNSSQKVFLKGWLNRLKAYDWCDC